MLYALTTICILITVLAALQLNAARKFNLQVASLFAQSESISAQIFSYLQLAGLPEPVEKYFKHVLKKGQPYISYARLKHDGQFKTGFKRDWVNINGEQYFTMQQPGFIWKGKTSLFTALDGYIAGEGRLVVKLFSLFKIADGKGLSYNEGELLRWLAESVWFPTNLLPSAKLNWVPINSLSAILNYKCNNLCLTFIVRFNDAGEIEEMETTRYMDKNKSAPWICRMSAYKEVSNFIVPTKVEAVWRLRQTDFIYAKFNVKKIEYNKPQIFKKT